MSPQEHHDLALLGKALRALREERALTVSTLAAASSVSAATISALEDGRLDPDFQLLLDIAAGIGVRPSELVSRAEQLAGDADA
jgi:transcriptional regulator with XRE-family HTH domain